MWCTSYRPWPLEPAAAALPSFPELELARFRSFPRVCFWIVATPLSFSGPSSDFVPCGGRHAAPPPPPLSPPTPHTVLLPPAIVLSLSPPTFILFKSSAWDSRGQAHTEWRDEG